MNQRKAKAARQAAAEARAAAQPSLLQVWRGRAVWLGVGLAVVVGVFVVARTGSSVAGGDTMNMDMEQGNPADHGSDRYPYAIGDPGPGQRAPDVKLPSTIGGTFDLAAYRNREPVLLYFQEGLMCQPCWDQIVAIQRVLPAFEKLGVRTMVSVTTDPFNLLQQKAQDEELTIPVLSDEGSAVSDEYTTRRYGMMNGMHPGHSFILVGKDGKIMWRADYGGPPKYTMFVPPDVLLSDLQKGLRAAA